MSSTLAAREKGLKALHLFGGVISVSGFFALVFILLWQYQGSNSRLLDKADTNTENSTNSVNSTGDSQESVTDPVSEFTKTLREYKGNRLLFFSTHIENSNKFKAVLYDLDDQKAVYSTTVDAGREIKDSYYGIRSSFDPSSGYIYFSTFYDKDFEEQKLDPYWEGGVSSCATDLYSSGCDYKIHRVNIVGGEVETVYESDALVLWSPTREGNELIIYTYAPIGDASDSVELIKRNLLTLESEDIYKEEWDSNYKDPIVFTHSFGSGLFAVTDKSAYISSFTNTPAQSDVILTQVDLKSGKTKELELDTGGAVGGASNSFVYSLDGNLFASGHIFSDNSSKEICVFDTDTGEKLTNFEVEDMKNLLIAMDNEDLLLWQNDEHSVTSYELSSGDQSVLSLPGQDDAYTYFPLSAYDGKYLLLVQNCTEEEFCPEGVGSRALVYDLDKKQMLRSPDAFSGANINSGSDRVLGFSWFTVE